MARPKSKDPRTQVMRFRATPGEEARIKERAIASGMKLPDFLRARALGLKPRSLQRPEPEPVRPPEEPVNPRITPEGVREVEVAAEVAESAMKDREAREAFIKRRTLQLQARYTSLVAARMAKEEWEKRGTDAA